MIVGKKIIFNFKNGVDDAIIAIADEIKNGYTVTSIEKKEQGISVNLKNYYSDLWEVELKKLDSRDD